MAFTVASTVSISDAQKSQFEELGYTIVPDALDADSLQTLREECAYFVGYIDGSMKARGRETYGITHRGKRYFISNRYRVLWGQAVPFVRDSEIVYDKAKDLELVWVV